MPFGREITMKKILASAFIMSIVFSVSGVYAQTAAPDIKEAPKDAAAANKSASAVPFQGGKLTVEEAIKLVLKNNQDLLDARYDANMADTMYQKFQSKYSIYVNAEGGAEFATNPEILKASKGDTIETYDISASIMKMFSTGTTVAAGVTDSFTKTKYNNAALPSAMAAMEPLAYQMYSGLMPSGTTENYVPVMYASIQQELLKNSFGYQERAQEKMLQNAGILQRNGVKMKISGLVTGALVDIWTVTVKKAAKDNAEISLKETRKVRDIIAANVRLGISETYDLNFYNMLYAGAETKYALANQDYKTAVRKFYRTMNYELDGPVPELTDVSVLTTELREVNLESAIKTAYAKRIDYNSALVTQQNAQSELGIQKNDALPSLVLSGTVSSMTIGNALGDTATKAATLDTPTYEVRMKMSYPLGDSGKEVNVRDARYKLQQANLRVDKSRREVKDDVVTKAEMISVMYSAYQKAKIAREESEKYYYSIQGFLKMGKIPSSAVKNALDALNDSRQRELESLVQYNTILLQMDIATNELLEKYNVNVDQYLAEAK